MPFSSFAGTRGRCSKFKIEFTFFDANRQYAELGIAPHIRVDMDKDDEYNGFDTYATCSAMRSMSK